MNRLVALALASLTFVAAGCDDDDDLLKLDSGVAGDAPRVDSSSGDGGDGGGAVACTGTFAGLNRTQLQGITNSAGNCAKASDLDLICTGDISEKVRAFGMGCLTAGNTSEAALSTCISNAVNAQYNFTAGCLNCYIASVGCSFQKCMAPCTTNAAGAECRSCQQAMGCLTAFFTCAGITPPGTGTDGGTDAGDGPRDGVDAGDAPRDGTDAADARDGGADAPDASTDAPDAAAG